MDSYYTAPNNLFLLLPLQWRRHILPRTFYTLQAIEEAGITSGDLADMAELEKDIAIVRASHIVGHTKMRRKKQVGRLPSSLLQERLARRCSLEGRTLRGDVKKALRPQALADFASVIGGLNIIFCPRCRPGGDPRLHAQLVC